MATIKCNSEFLTITLRNKSVAYNFSSDTVHDLEFPRQNHDVKNNNEKHCHVYESVFPPSCDISNCGQWFVSSVDKYLLLWKTLDWSLVGSGDLHRLPTNIIFSPDGSKIIVADKGGDVYVFSKDNLSEEGRFLLGHLSPVFDMIVTKEEKFIITCDRDEKIKVSCFPNAYNIVSYCLGHEEFVTCVKVLPHSQNILISASGDGTLRFWDFKIAKELTMYTCSKDLDKTKFMFDENDPTEHTPIVKFEVFMISNNESLLCVLFDHYKGCLLYNIKGTDRNISCSKLQHFIHNAILLDVCINKDLLWFSSCQEKCKVFVLQWNSLNRTFETSINNEHVNNAVITINKCLDNVESTFRSSFSVLYKKQYDTVQEYYKRKNEMICESSKKNKT